MRKQRGSKTYGWGSPKKHRGSGSRGGMGKAGFGKKGSQKKTLAYARGYGVVGDDRGFTRPGNHAHIRTINLSEIEAHLASYLEQKIAVREGSVVSLDMSRIGVTKVLGSGRITLKIKLTAAAFSRKAEEKIKAAGGEAISTGAPAQEESKSE